MIAMPIWDSMVRDRLLVHMSGAHTSNTANRPQINQRPTLIGLNS